MGLWTRLAEKQKINALRVAATLIFLTAGAVVIGRTTDRSVRATTINRQAGTQVPPPSPNGIAYYGGPVITSPTGPNLYYIWYGDWSGNTAEDILTDLARHLGGSPYFDIMGTYHDASNARVKNAVNFLGSIHDDYSHGTAVSSSQIQSIVRRAITTGLPRDADAVYMVLTSRDVVPPNFCSGLCGTSGHFAMEDVDIKYGWVGDPTRCPTRCAPGAGRPNGNLGADAMASTVTHEFINAVTNSNRNGWHDARGRGPASICATPQTAFPVTYPAPNGEPATVKLGTRHYFIQTNWVNAGGGYCAMAVKNTSGRDSLTWAIHRPRPNAQMEPTRR